MLLAGPFGFSSGTMMSCLRLACTCPARKLQLSGRSTRPFATLPSCFSSLQRTSSSSGTVPEDSSRSATSSCASVMGRNVLRAMPATSYLERGMPHRHLVRSLEIKLCPRAADSPTLPTSL
ncbi:hypothetical protein TRVL_10314 [Trypanosoma vivax]|nr:hypothetical protein TRVL_10314 [Trypanosoma vivax]